jgi:hypothetical protein
VNFFALADPYVSIGSVAQSREPTIYHWRCYLGEEAISGAAHDMRTAQRSLLGEYRKLLNKTPAGERVPLPSLSKEGTVLAERYARRERDKLFCSQ